jgi:hypothetical protein
MANLQQTIYLDNEERDLEFSNQYVKLENGKVKDVYVLIGDKHQVSIMRSFETNPILHQLITDRVNHLLEVKNDLDAQLYDEVHGEGEVCAHSEAMQNSDPLTNVFEGFRAIYSPNQKSA